MIPKKNLGQHWLTDTIALQSIASSLGMYQVSTCLEIGPGTGNLSELLAEIYDSVIAVEFDRDAAVVLDSTKSHLANLTVYNEPIQDFDFDIKTLSEPYVIIANIPYNISKVIFRLLQDISNKPVAAALLVQKEVAQRVSEDSGSSVLSIGINARFETELGVVVGPESFDPPPKVQSQVIIMKCKDVSLYQEYGVSEATVFRFAKQAFLARRKKLTNSLVGFDGLTRQDIEEELESLALLKTSRPQELSTEIWFLFAKRLSARLAKIKED